MAKRIIGRFKARQDHAGQKLVVEKELGSTPNLAAALRMCHSVDWGRLRSIEKRGDEFVVSRVALRAKFLLWEALPDKIFPGGLRSASTYNQSTIEPQDGTSLVALVERYADSKDVSIFFPGDNPFPVLTNGMPVPVRKEPSAEDFAKTIEFVLSDGQLESAGSVDRVTTGKSLVVSEADLVIQAFQRASKDAPDSDELWKLIETLEKTLAFCDRPLSSTQVQAIYNAKWNAQQRLALQSQTASIVNGLQGRHDKAVPNDSVKGTFAQAIERLLTGPQVCAEVDVLIGAFKVACEQAGDKEELQQLTEAMERTVKLSSYAFSVDQMDAIRGASKQAEGRLSLWA